MIAGLIIAIVVLLIFSIFFSSADMTYASVNQLRLKKSVEKGSKSAKLALKFAQNYDETITTILFCNNLVNIGATSLATVLGYQIFTVEKFSQSIYDLSPTIMSIILFVLLLIFGEIFPKVIARAYSYRFSLLFAYPIAFFKIIIFPIVYVSTKFGKLCAKPFIKDSLEAENNNSISDDELNQIIETIQEEGVIDEDQEELVKSAIIFKDTEAHEIMTPRVDIFALDIDSNISEVLLSDEAFTHSRIPVFKDNLDNIIGVLSTKTLLRKILAKEKIDRKLILSLMQEAHYVPFSMGISEILEDMKRYKHHIVIIKDEYGGTDGLLTMEDILEELVGDMFDEMDTIKQQYVKIKRSYYEVDGNMNIDDFFELVSVEKPLNLDVSTVGGWCLDVLEKFAKVGDKFNYENLKVEIKEVNEFTVEKILVKVSKKKS